jgi:signal transduction histidine kinase
MEELDVGRAKMVAAPDILLHPGTYHVVFHFTAIDLASPENVRLQYRLDGVDPVWLDADSTRTAIYTSIPIGAHSFHIRATNSDGVWDRAGIVYRVRQQPFFYETKTFRAAALLMVALLAVAAYRRRVRQIAANVNARFDERLAERTRLARDIHDTLLQTIQASKMAADLELEQSADQVRMRKALERLSGWLGRAVQEARSAVESLRSSTAEGSDLAEALRRAGEECRFQSSIEFALAVEGSDLGMHPIVRDEVYRIGYEAIRNACAHSEASVLQVEVSYVEDLKLRVRDNGKGLDPDIAARGKSGHFGLIGMYERASRVRGRLTISSPGLGTEVELVVPRQIAFRQLSR